MASLKREYIPKTSTKRGQTLVKIEGGYTGVLRTFQIEFQDRWPSAFVLAFMIHDVGVYEKYKDGS